MADKVYVGDLGTYIDIDCNEDISGATVHKIIVRKPNGVIAEWSGEIVGTDILRHTTILGDLDVPGIYRAQPYLTIDAWTGRGATANFTVYSRFV